MHSAIKKQRKKCQEEKKRNPKIKERFKKMYNGFITMLEGEIRSYADKNPDLKIDTAKTARLIISIQEGLDIYKDLFPDDEDFQKLGDFIKLLILKGLTP